MLHTSHTHDIIKLPLRNADFFMSKISPRVCVEKLSVFLKGRRNRAFFIGGSCGLD